MSKELGLTRKLRQRFSGTIHRSVTKNPSVEPGNCGGGIDRRLRRVRLGEGRERERERERERDALTKLLGDCELEETTKEGVR